MIPILQWKTFEDPDDALDFWYTNIRNVLDGHEPLRIKRVRHNFNQIG